jgi:hypothetical protein
VPACFNAAPAGIGTADLSESIAGRSICAGDELLPIWHHADNLIAPARARILRIIAMPFRRLIMLLTFAFAGLGGLATPAAALDPAQGEVLLTVTGAITETNDGDSAAFDLEMLQGLPAVSFETTTIWTEGVQTFEGVALSDLLEAVGAEGETLSAVAFNDYAVDIPASDAVTDGPIIAYLRNGAPMSLRNKGPLWIVYPYDANPDYQSETIYARSIWQLNRIEVRP